MISTINNKNNHFNITLIGLDVFNLINKQINYLLDHKIILLMSIQETKSIHY